MRTTRSLPQARIAPRITVSISVTNRNDAPLADDQNVTVGVGRGGGAHADSCAGCRFSLGSQSRSAGAVTSGTFSPLLQHGIALGYVPPELKGSFEIECHSKKVPAQIVQTPFYKK